MYGGNEKRQQGGGASEVVNYFCNADISINGSVCANASGEKEKGQLYLQLSVENKGTKVMKDFSISFNSNK
jgi:hypothetical protein